MAAQRALRIADRAAGRPVLDATCGAGGDSVALARAGLFVVSMDRDPERALCASQNLRLLGLPDRVVVGDALRVPLRVPLGGSGREALIVLDPARRHDGARTLDPDLFSPPLGAVLELASRAEGASVKLAPGLDPEALEQRLARELRTPFDLEWVDLDRELCELTLWTGVLADSPPDAPGKQGTSGAARVRSAVSLGTGSAAPAIRRLTGVPSTCVSLEPSEVSSIRWFLEPNPAVIRAGLVGNLGSSLGMRALGPGLAWLVGDEAPATALGKAWPVLEAAPADRRRVRAMLARHGIGPLAVKKRGHPDAPDVLARRFRGPGERPGLIAVGRLARGHAVLLLGPPLAPPG